MAAPKLQLIAGGDFPQPEVRRLRNQQQDRWVTLSSNEQREQEAVLLEDPSTQVRHAVGRYHART